MWEITNISGQILNHDLNSQASEFVTMDRLVNPSRKLGDTLTTANQPSYLYYTRTDFGNGYNHILKQLK